MLRKYLVASIVLLVIAATSGTFFYLRHKQQEAHTTVPAATPAPQYRSGSEVALSGVVQARNVVLIPSPMDGVLEQVTVGVGDEVSEGQLLAQIKNDQLAQDLRTQENELSRMQERVGELESALSSARLEESRATADSMRAQMEESRTRRLNERAQMLMQEGAGTRNAATRANEDYEAAHQEAEAMRKLSDAARAHVQDARRQLDAARSALQDRENELEDTRAGLEASEVFSPVNGVLASQRFHQGEPVTVEVPDLFTIAADLHALMVAVSSDREVVSRLSTGQKVTVLAGDSLQPVPGVIREIRATGFTVDFDNELPSVRPGQKAQVRVTLK